MRPRPPPIRRACSRLASAHAPATRSCVSKWSAMRMRLATRSAYARRRRHTQLGTVRRPAQAREREKQARSQAWSLAMSCAVTPAKLTNVHVQAE